MQFGFRSKHSTETANCYMLEKIKQLIDLGGVVGAVFLDLRKAFDTVNHKVLSAKLAAFNLSENALLWAKSYFSNHFQSVCIQNQQSTALPLQTGVPQGSILGPLFFSMFINDLPSVCPEAEIQMYADDTVVYVHSNTKAQVAAKLTNIMVKVTEWLNQCCLELNVSKTMGMFFTKINSKILDPDIFVAGEKLQIVPKLKYLGIILDSTLSFRSHIKLISRRVKYNVVIFRSIRNCMSTQAAKMYLHSMIISHLTYCMTSYSQACSTTLTPLESLYKQALKILDKKPYRYHHCLILKKYNLLSWENLMKHTNICLMYRIINGVAPPPLARFVETRSIAIRVTRGATRGDCVIPFRESEFSKSAFSVRTANEWNLIPVHIRQLSTIQAFKGHTKKWLLDNQVCQH